VPLTHVLLPKCKSAGARNLGGEVDRAFHDAANTGITGTAGAQHSGHAQIYVQEQPGIPGPCLNQALRLMLEFFGYRVSRCSSALIIPLPHTGRKEER